MTPLLFTTSWDDGHPLDLRLAELLAKYGFRGTFYVPCWNWQGEPVLSGGELRDLDRGFEIASHTLEHRLLTTMNRAEVRRQIIDGKAELENRLGTRVDGFCYPGGRHNAFVRQTVREAGFAYGRSIRNLCLLPGADPFLMATTIQCYPHSATVYTRNYLRGRDWIERFPLLVKVLASRGMLDRLIAVFDLAIQRSGVFHLWGHSWEIDRIRGWRILEEFLRYVAEHVDNANRVDNAEIHHRFS